VGQSASPTSPHKPGGGFRPVLAWGFCADPPVSSSDGLFKPVWFGRGGFLVIPAFGISGEISESAVEDGMMQARFCVGEWTRLSLGH